MFKLLTGFQAFAGMGIPPLPNLRDSPEEEIESHWMRVKTLLLQTSAYTHEDRYRLLEAQAAGIPVVSCAVRGVPDVVCDGRTGLLAAPGDAAGLADLARQLINDPARRTAMGQAAAQFVVGERSTGEAARQLNRAFADLQAHMPATATAPLGSGTPT